MGHYIEAKNQAFVPLLTDTLCPVTNDVMTASKICERSSYLFKRFSRSFVLSPPTPSRHVLFHEGSRTRPSYKNMQVGYSHRRNKRAVQPIGTIS